MAIVIVALLSALVVSLARLLIKWLLLRHASERWSRVVGKALRPAQFMAATGGVQILLYMMRHDSDWGPGTDGWNSNLSQALLFGTVASGAWMVSNLLSIVKDPCRSAGALSSRTMWTDASGARRSSSSTGSSQPGCG
ncbi:hypothetical protein GCM10029992_10890 [Glycomyces albus]